MIKRNEKLFEHLINILADGEWHTIEELADDLSLSIESFNECLTHLEKAEVLQVEGGQYKKKSLVKGTHFVKSFLNLPTEKPS